jgi:hypothetical protein
LGILELRSRKRGKPGEALSPQGNCHSVYSASERCGSEISGHDNADSPLKTPKDFNRNKY